MQIILYSFFETDMKHISVAEIYKDHTPFLGQDLCVKGRVRSIRDSKSFGFIELND